MTKSILIIDDEEHIRRMMRITLESAGYSIGEANDGAEGLKVFGDGSRWDAVVLDQRMPGMEGLEVLERLSAGKSQARVIMATAYASVELAVEAMKLGASDFVRKPMTPEVLRNVVAAALSKVNSRTSGNPANRSIKEPGPVETITMNGFSILDPESDEWRVEDQRRFTVVSPGGTRHVVLVQIDEEVIAYVKRITKRHLSAASSFWTEQARSLLADYLWNKGEIPATRKLTLQEIGRDKLLTAERWNDQE